MSDARNKNAENKFERRRALKALTAGGALAGVSSLPQHWTKPVIDSIVLPAHAATTGDGGASSQGLPTTTQDPCPLNCNINVNMDWNWSGIQSTNDIFLEVLTPGGTRISPDGAVKGRCLEVKSHDGQADIGHTRIANITSDKISAGRYHLYADVRHGTYVSVGLSVSTCDEKTGISTGFNNTGVHTLGYFDVSTGGTTTTVNLN